MKAKFSKGIQTAREGNFVSVPPDETVQIVSLSSAEEMLSASMHEFWEVNPFVSFPCFGTPECPGCRLGNKTKFKGFLPVVTREGDVKIFSFGIKVARQLDDIESELGDISSQVIKVKRTGSGLGTNYTCVPVGKKINIKKYEVIDIIAEFGDLSLEGIQAVLVSRGLMDEAEVIEAPEEEETPKKTSTRGRGRKKAEPEVEEEVEGSEEDEDAWDEV